MLEKVLSGEPKLAGPAVEQLLQNIKVQPAFDHSGNGQSPRLILRAATLWEFMTLEIVYAAAAKVRVSRCEHCDTAFFTGPMTGRRSHGKYCSDRCRVAAMRERKAAKEGEGVSAKT